MFGVLPNVPVPGEREEPRAPPQLIVLLLEHLARCAAICGQAGSPGQGAGQRPKGKGQTTGAETKLDQLIHANLFKSFWDMGLDHL